MKSLLLFSAIAAVAAGILGVHPDKQHLYKPDSNNNWACLSDPQIVLSHEQVNDNYCDCPDGSDEPSTNACPFQYSQFYCNNKGHIPSYIDHFKVGDGVCDYDLCCDGSDELVCPDKCNEISTLYQAALHDYKENIRIGLKEKEKLIAKADKKRKDLIHSFNLFEEEILSLNKEVQKVEKNTFNSILLDQLAPHLSTLEKSLTAKEKIIAQQCQQIEKLESILSNLMDDYNPNFNDLAVKQSVSSFRDFLSNKEAVPESETFETSSIISIIKKFNISTPTIGELIHQYYQSLINSFLGLPPPETAIVKNEIEDNSIELGNKNENRIKSLKKESNDILTDLSHDYGPRDILRALVDTCITNKLGEYNYRLCFGGGLYQGDVLIGKQTFSRKDKEDSSDMILLFENGSKCWNGPHRSGRVEIICGSENQILSVSEPEKCAYELVVKSPIGCVEDDNRFVWEY